MYRAFILTPERVRSRPDHKHEFVSIPQPAFTNKQGQYLAFIYAYTKVNGRPPAEADMRRFFGVTAPSVHNMVKALERAGLITRKPGKARTIAVTLDPTMLPVLR